MESPPTVHTMLELVLFKESQDGLQPMVPTWTGKQGKPGKMGRHFQSRKSQGILSRLEKSGDFPQNTGKIRKNYTGKLKKGNLSSCNSENRANMIPYFQ